jgi:hypothetical protein
MATVIHIMTACHANEQTNQLSRNLRYYLNIIASLSEGWGEAAGYS